MLFIIAYTAYTNQTDIDLLIIPFSFVVFFGSLFQLTVRDTAKKHPFQSSSTWMQFHSAHISTNTFPLEFTSNPLYLSMFHANFTDVFALFFVVFQFGKHNLSIHQEMKTLLMFHEMEIRFVTNIPIIRFECDAFQTFRKCR